MRYWGWRPLVFSLWISVLITACSDTQQLPNSTPTLQPVTTLIQRFATAPPSVTPSATPHIYISASIPTEPPAYYRASVEDTWVSIAHNFGISPHLLQQFNGNSLLVEGETVRIPSPLATYSPQTITITPPICHETPTDALLCLGELTNTQPYAIGRVTLRLALTRSNGSELASQIVHIAARWLPPGQSSPYHAIFDRQVLAPMTAATAYYGMVVIPLSADHVPELRLVQSNHTLEIVDEGFQSRDNYVVVSGTMVNRSSRALDDVRVIATLYNVHGQVVGYRVIEVAQIGAGETLPLRVLMLPTTEAKLARPLTYTWFVNVALSP